MKEISGPQLFVRDTRKFLLELGTSDWIEVYREADTDSGSIAVTSALIPEAQVELVLSKSDWIFDPHHLTPGCVKYSNGNVLYLPFGSDKGYEPFVLEREFHRIKPGYVEIKEEFRLFHNLYFDGKNKTFIKIKDDGSEHEVIRIRENLITVRAVELKQFLAIKEMRLALLFDIRRRYKQPLKEMESAEECQDFATPQLRYTCAIRDTGFRKESFVRVHGKKLIAGFAKKDSDFWPYNEAHKEEEKNYPPFIVGLDERGKEVTVPCLPYGDQYLTPVYFRSEVLNRYYENPSKYSVEDGYLRCGGLWGVAIDNDNPSYVTVFLGDLGRDLPESERSHWRTFNIPPAGGMSETAFRRSFMAEFADPTRMDLAFKQRFNDLEEKWQQANGWPLFKPLAKQDSHCFASLRIPATDEQNEFDTQVMYLTKLLVDSINESEIGKHVSGAPDQKGISKLEKYLESKSLSDSGQHILFLRDLQALRSSGSAHRKSANYEKAAERLGLHEKDPRIVYSELLGRAIAFLEALASLL